MRYKKLLLGILVLGLIASPCFAAWDETTPANNCKLSDAPALIRANWAALMALTDPDLCINDAKMCAVSAIGDDHLAQITTASKVSGAAVTLLGSVPAGGGQLPIANGGTGQSTATAACTALLPSQTGNSGKALITNATVQSWGYPASLTIASAATGDLLYYNGSAWVRLAAGTSNYYLKAAGASAPVWTDIFNTSTGIDHDGTDSKKVLYTNLDMTGITNGHVLYNNNGTPAGQALPAQVTGAYQDGATYIEATAATERSFDTTSYAKVKQFSPMSRSGTITLVWSMKSGNGDTPLAYSKVYVNDIAVGTEKSTASLTYVTQTQTTITVNAGDVVQIYAKRGANCSAGAVNNLYLKCLNPTIPQEVTNY